MNNQNRQPKLLTKPSNKNSKIHPKISRSQPPIPKTTKPIITKTMIPIIVSIFIFVCYNYNIVLIYKNSNIIRITYYIY